MKTNKITNIIKQTYFSIFKILKCNLSHITNETKKSKVLEVITLSVKKKKHTRRHKSSKKTGCKEWWFYYDYSILKIFFFLTSIDENWSSILTLTIPTNNRKTVILYLKCLKIKFHFTFK